VSPMKSPLLCEKCRHLLDYRDLKCGQVSGKTKVVNGNRLVRMKGAQKNGDASDSWVPAAFSFTDSFIWCLRCRKWKSLSPYNPLG